MNLNLLAGCTALGIGALAGTAAIGFGAGKLAHAAGADSTLATQLGMAVPMLGFVGAIALAEHRAPLLPTTEGVRLGRMFVEHPIAYGLAGGLATGGALLGAVHGADGVGPQHH